MFLTHFIIKIKMHISVLSRYYSEVDVYRLPEQAVQFLSVIHEGPVGVSHPETKVN